MKDPPLYPQKLLLIWTYVICFSLFCIGYIPIAEGATVIIAPSAVHRNEQIFPDPHKGLSSRRGNIGPVKSYFRNV